MRLVLVLDDSDTDRLFIGRAFAKMRPEVVTIDAISPEVALQALSKSKVERGLPDLMIVDVNLKASMDGFEFVRRAQELARIPALLISGLVTPEMKERAARQGTPIATKPMTPRSRGDAIGWEDAARIVAEFNFDLLESRPGVVGYEHQGDRSAAPEGEPPPTPHAYVYQDPDVDWVDDTT